MIYAAVSWLSIFSTSTRRYSHGMPRMLRSCSVTGFIRSFPRTVILTGYRGLHAWTQPVGIPEPQILLILISCA